MAPEAPLEVHPLTPERWDDFAALFGPGGASSGCWCMWWRETNAEFERNGNAGNRRAMRALVRRGRRPGLIAYRDGRPVGWCSIAPREQFGRLQRSPKLKPVDERPVWSIVCFFVARDARRSGVSRALIDAAVEYAAGQGAELVEAYPVSAAHARGRAAEAYTGVEEVFAEAGFEAVARPGKRAIVRRAVGRGR